MAVAKSPFLVYQNFLSPKTCEQFCDAIGFLDPDIGLDEKPMKMFKHNEMIEEIIFTKLQMIVPSIEKHYDVKYKGTERIPVEWFAEGVSSKPQCENSLYLKKKWVRTYTRDISAVLFFNSYQDILPFDSDYEVFGGK